MKEEMISKDKVTANEIEKSPFNVLFHYLVFISLIILYVFNISKYFWTLAAPSDPLQYLGSAIWGTTYGYWPWLDRIALAVNLRIFSVFFNNSPETSMFYIGFINMAIIVLSIFWAFRKSGFWAALFVGVILNSSYLMLGWATYLYADQTVALYSLLAFIFFFSDSPPKNNFRNIVISGIFTGFAIFTKAPAIAVLIFFIICIICNKNWKKLLYFAYGTFAGSLAVIALFIILYNFESFINVWRLFFGGGLASNIQLTHGEPKSYYNMLTSLNYFPFLALFVAISSYRNQKTKYLFILSLVFIIGMYIIRPIGAPVPSYIYTAYIFAALGFSIYLSDLIGDAKASVFNNIFTHIAISALLIILLIVGLRIGFKYSPVPNFEYGYNYYKPLDIYAAGGLINEIWVIYLYAFGPIIIIGLLAYLEFSKSKIAVILFIVFSSLWLSFFNGGLAFKKAEFDRAEAAAYYEFASILNEVPVDNFNVYITDWGMINTPEDRILWVYRIFSDKKYQRVFEPAYKSQIENERLVRGNISFLRSEAEIVSARKAPILTDKPDIVIYYFPDARKISTITWNDKTLTLLDISKAQPKNKL